MIAGLGILDHKNLQQLLRACIFVVATLSQILKNTVILSFFVKWFLNLSPCFSETALREKSFDIDFTVILNLTLLLLKVNIIYFT